jgi:ribonuclease R
VKLDETGADGFIPARTIGEDYYRYHEARHALIGDHTGESYRLGDRVTVKLVEAAPVAGALRFELLSEGRYESAPKRTRGRHPARAQVKAHAKAKKQKRRRNYD